MTTTLKAPPPSNSPTRPATSAPTITPKTVGPQERNAGDTGAKPNGATFQPTSVPATPPPAKSGSTPHGKQQTHDEIVCFCDADIGMMSLDPLAKPDLNCGCYCPKCVNIRTSLNRVHRIAVLEARLVKSGIDIDDLAEIIRLRLSDAFANEVERIAREECKRSLQGLTLVSKTKW